MTTEIQNTELWAVHAQGPDDIYPAYDRADAERHAAELNALPAPPGISVAAVVIPSPLDPLAHWQGVAEHEREHKLHLLACVAPTDANLSAMRKEGLSIDGDNAYKRDLLDAVVGALAFGKQRGIQPPTGHWLERFYEIGKAEADDRDAQRGYMAGANSLTTAARDVLAERQRQVSAEGWTPEHDDEHGDGQMALAAGSYATYAHEAQRRGLGFWPPHFPWHRAWWKPCEPRRMLVKAGALILAEIERLDRNAAKQVEQEQQQ